MNLIFPASEGNQKVRTNLINRLNSPVVIILLLTFSLIFSFVCVKGGVAAGILILIGMFALPIVYAVVVFPLFGIIALLTMAFFLFFILRMGVNFPLGTLLDGLQLLLIIGFLIKQKIKPEWGIFKSPVSLMILLWIGYNLLQVANPWAESRLAWVYTVRSIAAVTIMYFVFVYHLRSLQSIRIIIGAWLVLSIIAAIYGFKQEWFGFSAKETAEMQYDPLLTSLLFIDGHWRKYSIFSDPVAFSYNMVSASLLCMALLTAKITFKRKIVLSSLTLFLLTAMLYSGTRGAYVLVPASLILFALLNFSRKIMLFSCIAAVFTAILIFIPTSNPTLYRFQSAFRPSDDASFNVRKANQKRIQPYILTHPVGGGLGATGAWGVRFAPQSYLSSFPPDSGYLRVAVEMGWIGLLLFCTLMFIILKTGIQNFYRIRNPELKIYCLAMTLIVFALNIGNFPQEALVQFPNNILFYVAAALIHTTYMLDKKQQQPERNNLIS